MQVEDLSVLSNRDYWERTLRPLLMRDAQFKVLRKRLQYSHANNDLFDEFLVKVTSTRSVVNGGVVGLSPTAVRQADMHLPHKVLGFLQAISLGQVESCIYDYLLSAAEQARIKMGMRPHAKQLFARERAKSDAALGPTGLLNKKLDENAGAEADVKKFYKDHRAAATDAEVQGEVSRVLHDALGEPLPRLLGPDGKPIQKEN